MLIAWNAISYKDEFLRDDLGPYLPKNEIVEAIESAALFYYIKKDKSLENLVKKIILSADTKPKIKSLAKDIKKAVFKKHPLLEGLELPDRIYLDENGIERVYVEKFDLEKKEFTSRFEKEVFKGVIEDFTISSPNLIHIKTALLSFARGLAEYEHKALEGTVLEPYITDIQNKIANEWEMTLRVGEWTTTPYKGDLLFFWRIKEVREKLLKSFNIDIAPKDILFIPKYKEFLGWCEAKS